MPKPTPTQEQAYALGRRLRERRQSLHMTQEQVAQLAGISLQHLSLLENGHSSRGRTASPANPTLGLIQRLAKALRVDVYYIVASIDELDPPQDSDDVVTRLPDPARGPWGVSRAKRRT